MTILSITRGQDTGGWGWRLMNAFRQYSDWTLRSIVRPNSFLYLQYPQDELTWTDAKAWWKRADVVHLHNDFAVAKILEPRYGVKPTVVQVHGTAFRENPTGVLQEIRKRGAIGIASTLDLVLIAPDLLEWCPSPYDLDWLMSLRKQALEVAA